MDIINEISTYYPNESTKEIETIVYNLINNQNQFQDIFRIALNGTENENVVCTLTFIRDVILLTYDKTLKKMIRTAFNSSKITEMIRGLLYSTALNIRQSAVYTLGKINDKDSVPLLTNIYKSSLYNDPLLLINLLNEINWLTDNKTFIDTCPLLLKQQYGVLRWILLDYLCSCFPEQGTKIYHHKIILLKKLIKDPRFYIREQALSERNEIMNKRKRNLSFNVKHFLLGNCEIREYTGPQLFNITSNYINELTSNGTINYGIESYQKYVSQTLNNARI